MPRRLAIKPAKRARRANPREDRNMPNVLEFRRGKDFDDARPKGKHVTIVPRNIAQEDYLDALSDESKSIVLATGLAGTGKSLLCTLYAILQLQNETIDKIVITRPAVGVDSEEHGFLPGTLTEKLMPWVQPILDIFKQHYSLQALTRMIENEVIEFVPVAFVRGRTFRNTIVIFDEAQNSLPTAMKAVLTRIGEGSRIFVTGDMDQHDRGYATNGLRDFIDRLNAHQSKCIAHCTFGKGDVERHPCVAEVLRLYEDIAA